MACEWVAAVGMLSCGLWMPRLTLAVVAVSEADRGSVQLTDAAMSSARAHVRHDVLVGDSRGLHSDGSACSGLIAHCEADGNGAVMAVVVAMAAMAAMAASAAVVAAVVAVVVGIMTILASVVAVVAMTLVFEVASVWANIHWP